VSLHLREDLRITALGDRLVLEQIVDQENNVSHVDYTLVPARSGDLTGTKGLTSRRRSSFEKIIDKIDDIADRYLAISVNISDQ